MRRNRSRENRWRVALVSGRQMTTTSEPPSRSWSRSLFHSVDAGHARHVVDVDRQHLHAEAERALGHRAAGAAEAHDAERLVVQLPLLLADGLAQAVVRPAHGGVQPAREAEQQREGVLGQVDADLALLAGQDHVAGHQLGREDGVDAGADRVVVAQPPCAETKTSFGTRPNTTSVSAISLRWVSASRGLDQRGARAGQLQDARAVGVGDGGADHVGRVEDLHSSLSMMIVSTHAPSSWPCSL